MKWRHIDSCPGYSVSDSGGIRNDKTGRLLRQTDHDGYLRVGLPTRRGRMTFRVHRLVAEAFLENPERKPYVNHRDGNTKNNAAENLEWCTASENCLHRYAVLGKYASEGVLKQAQAWRRKSVVCVETGAVYESIAAAANAIGHTDSAIRNVLKGRRSSAGGYTWRMA